MADSKPDQADALYRKLLPRMTDSGELVSNLLASARTRKDMAVSLDCGYYFEAAAGTGYFPDHSVFFSIDADASWSIIRP